jgi:cullin-4
MPRHAALLKGGGSGPRRKIVIKPFSKPPALPADYYDKAVEELLHGTTAVVTRSKTTSSNPNQNQMSLQHSYQTVVHLVSHRYGPRLYKDLVASMQAAAEQVLQQGVPQSETAVLQYVATQFSLYTEYLTVCKHVFLPLDRTHVWQAESAQAVPVTLAGLSIWQAGLQQFGARLAALKLDKQVYQQWLGQFLQDWNGGTGRSGGSANGGNRSTLQSIWYMWQDLQLLQTLPLQQDLEAYWSQQAATRKEDVPYNAVDFLSYSTAKHWIVSQWPWLPAAWLWSVLDQCLVQTHLNADYLLHPSNLHPLLLTNMSNNNPSSRMLPSTPTHPSTSSSTTLSSVQQLWMLAGRLPFGQTAVAAAVAAFAKDQGITCARKITNNVTALVVIQELLLLQGAISSMIRTLPAGPELISLKSVWEDVANTHTSPSIAEGLAKFLDQILRSNKRMDQLTAVVVQQAQQDHGANTTMSISSDDWLIKIIAGLFVPIQAKDVFEAFYKRDLAKRLLWNRVVSMDVEKQVVALLKAECGTGYTSKMEGMFQDVEWSRETMMVYKQSTAANPAEGVEMEAQLLTTGYWPVYPQYPNLHLPLSLKKPQDHFTNHYMTKYQGRRMTWQYALGNCVVRAAGFNKTYELVVGLVQALVLVEFAAGESKTLPALMQAVGLEDRDDMERILQSLTLGKDGTRILRKLDYDVEPGKKKKIRPAVDDRDKFCINESFESNQRRIRITNIMMKETKAEREKTVETVSRDRLYLIDAVLVRVMKARKTILHQQLIPQVLEQVKVPAQPADVKKRIESLIEREYMERDGKDRNRYNYLA